MPYKIVYFEAARQDVKDAKAWYRKQLKGLENRFAAATKLAIIELSKQPFSYAIRHKNIRIAHPICPPYRK